MGQFQPGDLKRTARQKHQELQEMAHHELRELEARSPAEVNELHIRMAFTTNADDAAVVWDGILELKGRDRRENDPPEHQVPDRNQMEEHS